MAIMHTPDAVTHDVRARYEQAGEPGTIIVTHSVTVYEGIRILPDGTEVEIHGRISGGPMPKTFERGMLEQAWDDIRAETGHPISRAS